MSDDDAELAALDAIIAKNDGRDDPVARWAAADALYAKAQIIDRRDGPAAALELYRDVAWRMEGVRDDGPRELRLCALNALGLNYEQLGYKAESRSVAEELVSEFFDDPPSEGTDMVLSGAFESVIQALGEPTAEVPRRILANAMGKQAQLLYDTNRPNIADARCRQLVDRFTEDQHPEIAYQIEWAKASLDYSNRYGRRRQWPRR
jgi:hypothetical protein